MSSITPNAGDSGWESLVQKLLPQVPAEQVKILEELVRQTYPGAGTVRVFHLLQRATGDNKLSLEYVARMPEPIPAAVLLLAAQALQNRTHRAPLRLTVAGKLLASVPDAQASVGPIIRCLTLGLSKSRTLERLIQLQSKVETCTTLDSIVETMQARVKLKCPRCKKQFVRPALIKHLWFQHRLEFFRGTVREPAKLVEEAIARAATEDDAEVVETAFRISHRFFPQATNTQVLQSIAARQFPHQSPIPPALLDAAKQEQAGLCGRCLAPIRDPIPELPPPLSLGAGRLAGEGYAVEVQDRSSSRTVFLTRPGQVPERTGAMLQRYSPRGFGVLISAWLFVPLFVFVLLGSARAASPIAIATLGSIALGLLYFAVRMMRKPLPEAEAVAVAVAWEELVPDLVRSRKATRFLIRLCRASANIGSPEDRIPQLKTIEDRLLDRPHRDAAEHQLLAAVRVVSITDGGKLGKDRMTGLLALFEPVFQAELPPIYCEAAAEMLHSGGLLAPSDQRRLALLLIGLAYDCQLEPPDVIKLFRFMPQLRLLLQEPSARYLRFVYAIWRGRHTEPWTAVGPATSLLALAKNSPSISRRILGKYPDALLRLDLPDSAERQLGEVILTARGIIVGEQVLVDPDATLDVIRSPRGSGWQLVMGSQRVQLDRKLSADVLNLLWGWLQYRTKKLLPQVDRIGTGKPHRVLAILKPIAIECPNCSEVNLLRVGKVGVKTREIDS